MGKDHLFLKNEFGTCLKFDKTRGRSDEEDASKDRKNYAVQREQLGRSSVDFRRAVEKRHAARSRTLDVAHFDMLSIDLLKVANNKLIKDFSREYGLSAISYSNMNQTVLFAIADEARFQAVFLPQIEQFCKEEDRTKTDYQLITLISNFKYWDSTSMKYFDGTSDNICDMLLELVADSPRIVNKQQSIVKAMKCQLAEMNILYKEIEPDIYQIDSIKLKDLNFLLDNFDVIQRVQALYTFRVRPNLFGEMVAETDASLNLLNGAPIIGIIDTGVHRVKILEPILEEKGIDLVNKEMPRPYEIDLMSDSTHGTTVATLAAFGNNFYRDITSNVIDVDAKIFSIKIQSGETGLVNIAGVRDAIIKAHIEYGIRIYNLSMSVGSKLYNQDVSTYAYLLDKLAYEYDLLIFISVGNLDTLDIKYIQEVASHPRTDASVKRFLSYPNHYYNPFIDSEKTECHDCECMNLCVPSESMNNMSVGAISESFNKKHINEGLSLGKEYPAYYSRKYHIDYNAKINGTLFKNYQKNKNLFKPDIVMPGGDQLDIDSQMLILAPRKDGSGLFIDKNSGTSYATPLAANIAAKIVRKYPSLSMQSVKAIIINSADSIKSDFLNQTIEDLKVLENNQYPNIDKKEKTLLSKKYSKDRLSKYISGYGRPNIIKCLESDDNRCTLIIEDEIQFDSHKVINLNIPDYLLQYSKKGTLLTLTATLCYKFQPVRADVLSYCPVHISFKLGNSMNQNDANMNAEEYAIKRASENRERMTIKASANSWSDDFFPASSKMFSNVQKMKLNITRDEIEKIKKQMSIIFRCTGRETLIGTTHPFSFVLTIEQKQSEDLDGYSLYDNIEACNSIEAISQAALELEA